MEKEINLELLIKVFFIVAGTILLKLILSYLSRRSQKKISKAKLVVLPQILILVCNTTAGIYILLLIYFIYRNYSKNHIILAICLFLLMCFLSIIFTRWKVIIGNSYLEIIPMIGRKRRLLFSDIDCVRKKTSGSLEIISKKKKAIGIENLCEGYSNIYKVLQQQGFLDI